MTRIKRILVAVLLVCTLSLFATDARGNEFLIDSRIIYGQAEGNQTNPKAAYGTDYFVVWEDKRGVDYDIYGAHIDLFGNLVDSAGIPIATGLGHQDHPAVAFNGTNFLVVWRENSDLYGVRVNTEGTVLDGAPIAISTATGDQSHPSICFGDTNYLVVWMDYRTGSSDVYATRVNKDGTVLDPGGIAISTATGGQTFPSVAFDGSNYLVVWEDDRNGVSNVDVYGARITQDGVVLEPLGFQIAYDESYNEQRPSVVYNPYLTGYYLVAWEDYRGPTVDIYGTRVFHDGTVIDDPVNIAISTADNLQEMPSVSSDGTRFFVAWKDYRSGLFSQTVYGARVDYYGVVLDASGIAISHSFEQYYPPAVIYGLGEFLIVHTYSSGAGYDIFGRFVEYDGDLSGSVDLARSANSQTYADVAFDGTNYLVVWQNWRYEYDIYGARVDESGSLVDTIVGICTEPDHQYHPQVAFDGTNYFAVWEHRDSDTSRIYGSRVTQGGDILDAGGFAISPSQYYQRNPAVAFGGINYLVVWDHQMNIYAVRVDTLGSVIDGGPIAITTTYDCENPSVAFDGTNYMVVWEKGMGMPFCDIYGSRVILAGEVMDPSGIAITSMADAQNPSVAFDGTNYLVTWEDNGIYGARVDTSGAVLGSKGIPICSETDAQLADVGFDGTNCLVVWQEPQDQYYDICGAKVSPSGEKIDSFEISTQSENQIQPALVKGSGERALIVHSSLTDSINDRSAGAMRIWGKFHIYTDVEEEVDPESPIAHFQLMQNYPNPFNSNTFIQYTLSRDTEVELFVYNILGQLVRTIFRGEQQRGTHILSWDGKDDQQKEVGSGIYFYQLKTADGASQTRKILFLK